MKYLLIATLVILTGCAALNDSSNDGAKRDFDQLSGIAIWLLMK
jgi:hypothetical protein